MPIFSRKQTADAAQEIADHLKLVDNVRALQQGQKELADAIATLGDRIRQIEADLKVVRVEAKLEVVTQTHKIVGEVQQAFNDKLTHLAINVDRLQNKSIGSQASVAALPKHGDGEISAA